MSRPSLDGLNIIYPPIDSSQVNFDLTNPINVSELDAQLDLWTNLAFQQDEPIINRPLTPTIDEKKFNSYEMQHAQRSQEIDLNNYNFLNQFSIDPFLIPPATNLPHNNSVGSSTSPSTESATTEKQVTKRQRTSSVKKSSTIEPTSPLSPTSPAPSVVDAHAAAISTSEDKRRRNTAASARFRAKKKEREAALEKKSKELETRVNELERECESLRRENGWLKGLVVGVTGASAGAASANTALVGLPQVSKRKYSATEEAKPLVTPNNES